MLTWTTYGTWLQGDKRGYVKKGKVLQEEPRLRATNKSNLKAPAVRLSKEERRIIKEAVAKEALRIKQTIYALAVCSDHVHVVCGQKGKAVGEIVRSYKNASYFSLRKKGYVRRLWTRGYDKRFCFDEDSLRARVDYVRKHNEKGD